MVRIEQFLLISSDIGFVPEFINLVLVSLILELIRELRENLRFCENLLCPLYTML